MEKKLGSISLYDNQYETLTKKEKYLVKQYNQLQWYIKQYKKDIFNSAKGNAIATWNIDMHGQKVNWKELQKIKLDNIEVFNTNVELERLGKLEHWIIPLRKSSQQKERAKKNIDKVSTQQQVNKGVDINMWNNMGWTPLDYIENKYQAERLTEIVKQEVQSIQNRKSLNTKAKAYYKSKGKQNGHLEKQKQIAKDYILSSLCVA
jgi:hypothetical protein